jgi:signal transduction histidine kinase/streptogramin lyase
LSCSSATGTLGFRKSATILKPADSRSGYACLRFVLGAISLLSALAIPLISPAARPLPEHVGASGEPLSRLHHTAWGLKDGAPPDIWALAQSADGFLWLGTGAGLFRFDGASFERYRFAHGQVLASNNITALSILPTGEIWIGFYSAGVSVLKPDGKITHYGAAEGMPEGMVFRFSGDNEGVLWAASDGGLASFSNGRWQLAGAESGYPAKRANWLLRDSRGTLWVSTGETVLGKPAQGRTFLPTGVKTGLQSVLAEATDGVIWISDGEHGTRPMPGLIPGEALPSSVANAETGLPFAKRMIFRDDGSLWATNAESGGMYRATFGIQGADSSPGSSVSVERLSRQQGLTAKVAVPLLEDREGNLWVGTNLGLNRFRHNNVASLPAVAATAHAGFALAIDPRGGIYAASGGVLYRSTGLSSKPILDGLSTMLAAHTGGDGTLWLLGAEDLLRVDGNRFAVVPLPGNRIGREVRALTSDSDGTLWASIGHQGFYAFRGKRWIRNDQLSEDLPAVLATDPDGRMWLGYQQDRVACLDHGSLRTYSKADGLDVGNVTAIHAGGGRVIVAGESGLAGLGVDGFRNLDKGNQDIFNGISGIVEDVNQNLWVNGTRGIIRIMTSELELALADPEHAPEYTLFDAEDGLPGVALQAIATSTAARSNDGLLWFSTNQGIAMLDPGLIASNALAPPVMVLSVTADGKAFPATRGVSLPQHTSSLKIDYTATSLVIPGRVKFRYMLEGVEKQWQDAGGRREAFYSNLGPGKFRFRVIAANNDGVWNEQGAMLEFQVEPGFFQTWWFLLMCVAATCVALWSLYLFRLRQMGAQIRSRLHERHMERERIARELHDTLLQSIQGLILRFQAAAARIPPNQPSRLAMEQALERADEMIAEGRDRVLDLRASASDEEDLAQALSKVAEELAEHADIEFRLVVEGIARPLDPIVRDELYRIGREAIVNAFSHADACVIEIRLAHARDEFRLSILDDGRGIDPGFIENGGRPGHWGLIGMRERAARIEAVLSVHSGQGSGTEVALHMKASLAYRPCLRESRWSWMLRLLGNTP